tara:strand:+ start:1402 stop:2133 length:732 start_codon:yes stop_codon:yes gene_type:complete
MEVLKNFTTESLVILHKYNQLIPLIKAIKKTEDIDSIKIEENEINLLLQEFCNKRKIQSEEELLNWLESNKLSKEILIDKISIPLRTISYAKSNFNNKVNSYFLKKKDDLDMYTYSLIRLKNKNKADEIFFRIQDEEESFSDLAFKYSEGFEKKMNGLVGPATVVNAHPKIASLLKSSSEGDLHPPVRIDQWFIILRLESFHPAILDETMEQKMALEMYEQSLESQARSKVENILKSNSYSVN